MTILVTGAAGFIGSAVVRHLVADLGRPVLAVDRLSYAASLGGLAAVAGDDRFRFAQGDIRDATLLDRLFVEHRPAAVIHLAAETHVDRSIDSPGAFVEHNVVGTFQLLEAARRHWLRQPKAERAAFRLLHVSTDEVFGSLADDGNAFTEDTPYRPSSPYSATKAASDHLARAWHATYGLPVVVTNCTNNFGPFQYPEKLIPLMIVRALCGNSLPVYGRGLNVRDWLYVDDHARGLVAALDRGQPGATYLFGGGAERRNLDVVGAVCDELDRLRPDPAGPRRRLIAFVADRPGHDLRYAVDWSATRDRLGWRPAIGFDEGLRRTVAWYLDNAAWWHEAARSGGYDLQRLGRGQETSVSDGS